MSSENTLEQVNPEKNQDNAQQTNLDNTEESDSNLEESDSNSDSNSDSSLGSDSGSDSGSGSEYSDIEEIDLTENPLYQVLSTLLEDNEGNNICSCINKLTDTIAEHNKLLLQLLSNKSN